MLLNKLIKCSNTCSSNARLFSALTAISPLDGRYSKQVNDLRPYYSEYALMKYRVQVEIEWFKVLFEHKIVSTDATQINAVKANHNDLANICKDFSIKDGERVKEIERTTNHDVKAIEYFLKEKFDEHAELSKLKEYLHFACTSEDINNLSYALMMHASL